MPQKNDRINGRSDKVSNTLSIAYHSLISRLTDTQDEFLHNHDFFEIIIIRYGSIIHCVHGEKNVMGVGDACIVSPNTTHSFIRKDECAHRDVMVSDALFKSTCDFLNIDLYEKLKTDGVFKFKITPSQIEDLENAYYAFSESDDENALHVYPKTICCNLLGTLYLNAEPVSNMSVFKSKCVTVINENYAKKDIMEILLSQTGYTQGHFCKKFKNTFQVTPVEYINRRRIVSAGSYLILSNYGIEECCHLVGFDSLPHFIKLFKAHYGTTPTKYRQTYRLISGGNGK